MIPYVPSQLSYAEADPHPTGTEYRWRNTAAYSRLLKEPNGKPVTLFYCGKYLDELLKSHAKYRPEPIDLGFESFLRYEMNADRLIIIGELLGQLHKALERLYSQSLEFSNEVARAFALVPEAVFVESDRGLEQLSEIYVATSKEGADRAVFFFTTILLLVECQLQSVEERILRYLKQMGFVFHEDTGRSLRRGC